MKNFADNRNIRRSAVGLCAAAAVAFASACGSNVNADADDRDLTVEAQRPDDALSSLMRAISEGDNRGFAAMCAYPIQRIYPLRCIEDSATMVDYFPVMVDDSLRSIARTSRPKDWEYYGWRGWALGDSTIIWFDDGVQFIDYESKAETGLRKMLARNEIMSLPESLQDGWTPVETLVEIDGDRIFRIDRNSGEYRLMEYDNDQKLRQMPTLILIGTMTDEGSAGMRVFAFADSTGVSAEYLPDAEPPVKIEITDRDKKVKSHKVKRGYWRDHLR